MHPIRIGRIVRTLRRRRGWRQIDLADRARVSQQVVSLIETGQIGHVSVHRLDRVLRVLEAELELNVRWRGGELDRVMDEGHAILVQAIAALLDALGWVVRVEVTYSTGADRGSIDVLAFHPSRSALLVIEVKTDITSAEATLRKHDEKVRVAGAVAQSRFAWSARSVSRLLVLPDASTARRRITHHGLLFNRAYLLRGSRLKVWLRDPASSTSGLVFVAVTNVVGSRRELTSRRRVRRPREDQSRHGHPRMSTLVENTAPALLSNTTLVGR